MTTTHANRVQMTVSGTPGTGTITLNAASSGYRTFGAAYGGNATVDILITEGTAWEVAKDCTYTHSGTTVTRGTLESSSTGSAVTFTSAAIVSVILPASKGNALELQLNRGYTFVRADGSTTQTTSSSAWSKISTALSSVVSNPDTYWDTSNKRFLPLRAGSYLITAGAQFNSGSADAQAGIYLNGALDSPGAYINVANCYAICTGIVNFNGSSDYAELWAYTGSALTTFADAGSVFFKAIYLGP